MNDKCLKIYKALHQGGLVISERNTGKTRAIAMMLVENPNAVAIVGLEQQGTMMVRHLVNLGMNETEAKRRVFHAQSHHVKNGFLDKKDVYVDEMNRSPYKGPFKGAVTSFPYAVKVIG